jgi:hypothetical protein
VICLIYDSLKGEKALANPPMNDKAGEVINPIKLCLEKRKLSKGKITRRLTQRRR